MAYNNNGLLFFMYVSDNRHMKQLAWAQVHRGVNVSKFQTLLVMIVLVTVVPLASMRAFEFLAGLTCLKWMNLFHCHP